jgi:hypothetical protein
LVTSGLLFVILGDPKWPSVALIPALVAEFLPHRGFPGSSGWDRAVTRRKCAACPRRGEQCQSHGDHEWTSIATTATNKASGEYVVNGLRPASYIIKVEAPAFRNVVRTRLVLAMSQQATVDFALSPRI